MDITTVELCSALIITSFFLLSSLALTIKFIANEITKAAKKRTPKLVFYSGLGFFIISVLLLTSSIVLIIAHYVFRKSWAKVLSNYLYSFYFAGQIYLLWLIMFIKLYFVFRQSVYKLSSITLKFFIILFIMLPLLILATLFYTRVKSTYYLHHPYTVYAFVVGFSLILTYLFVYKLFQLFRDTQRMNEDRIDPNNRLLSIMTKTTILTLTSVIFTNFVPLSIKMQRFDMEFWVIILDVYTNFICAILSYSVFNHQYQMICGCCDRNCKACLFKLVSERAMKVVPADSDVEDTDLDEDQSIMI